MGTRGIYGFKKNDEYKITVRTSDSYIRELGSQIVDFCKSCTIDELNDIYDNMILIDECILPTEDQIKKYYNFRNPFYYCHLKNRRKKPITWFSLINLASNNPINWKNGLDVMVNDKEYLGDGDMEYTYIIDLDTNKLNVYYNRERIDLGNKKIGIFDLENIPEDCIDKLLKIEKSYQEKEEFPIWENCHYI